MDMVTTAEAGDRRALLAEFRHGWPVVVAGGLGTAVGILGVSYALAILMAPLTAEFGWSRSEVAIANTFYTGAVFFTTPWYGRLYDRLGVRGVGIVCVLLYAAAQLATTLIGGSIWTLYLAYTAIGLLGAGTGYLAYSRTVAVRFDKGRGLAMALTMLGPTVIAVVIPLVLPDIIGTFGWRGGYVAMGLWALLALPLIFCLLGEPKAGVAAKAAPAAGGLTIGEAVRTRRFWFLFGGVFLSSLGVVGLHLHFVPMMTDLGGDPIKGAHALSLLGVGVFVGRLACGALMDRFHAPFVAAVLILSPVLGFLLFEVQGVAAAPFLAFCIGVTFGAESDVVGYLCSRYFGLKSYTEIFGWLYGAFALGATGSPLLLAAVYELTGAYDPCRAVAGGLCIVAAALFATAGPYRQFVSLEPNPRPAA